MKTKKDILGQLEQLVLSAVITLRKEAYGLAIHERVMELSGEKWVNPGKVYVTLDRLEEKGYVTSVLVEPTPERGGKPRRYYTIQASGEEALQEAAATAKRIVDAVGHSWRIGKWKKPSSAT